MPKTVPLEEGGAADGGDDMLEEGGAADGGDDMTMGKGCARI
jgi:hypothetical protein